MIRLISKNSLILLITLSMILPTFDNIAFASPATPEGGGDVGAGPAKIAANDAALVTLHKALELCMPAPEGALTAIHSIPSNEVTGNGVCTGNLAFGLRDAAIESANATAKSITFLQRLADFASKIAYILLKKVILDKLVDALVNWIKNTDSINSPIIQNWDKFFADAGQNAVGVFAQGLAGNILCKPFNLHLQLVLLPVEQFSTMTCTLNDIIGNINGFLTDFRNGSWLAYQESWYPRNNFYGGVILEMDAAASGAAAAAQAASAQSATSLGFNSQKVDDYFLSSTGPYKDKKGTPAEPGYTGLRYVKETRILTPGAFAANAAVETLITAPVNKIIHAEDMTAYLTAILDASINRLTTIGIKGLAGYLAKNTPSNLDLVNVKNPCAGLTGNGFSACLSSVNAEGRSFQNTQAGVAAASTGSLTTRVQVADTLNQAITLQSKLVNDLTLLSVSSPSQSTTDELITEQTTLADLQNSLQDNQTFVDGMLAQINQIYSAGTATPNTAIIPQDYINLSNSASTQFADDITAASAALSDAQNSLQTITDNTNSRIPAIEAQLPPGSFATSTPATP